MPAHVQERIDLAFGIAHDNHRLRSDLEQKEISARGYLAVVTDAQPRSQENARNHLLVELRIAIHLARQRMTCAPAPQNTVEHWCSHHAATGRRRLEMTDAVATD